MQKVLISLERYEKVLINLQNSIEESEKEENRDKFEYFRDSTIQRFEYCVELAWKLVKIALKELELIECVSPKDCIRTAFKNTYIENIDIWENMIIARNETSHNYDQCNAQKLFSNILVYEKYLQKLLIDIKNKINAG